MSRLKHRSFSSLRVSQSFSGWNLNELVLSKETTNSINVTNHPLIQTLLQEKELLQYIIEMKLIILLPSTTTIRDITLNSLLLQTHLIHLDNSLMRFITLSGIIGSFKEQKLYIHNNQTISNHNFMELHELF
ncbi:hypothetical protein QTN25_002639 [Entamoeba marina]